MIFIYLNNIMTQYNHKFLDMCLSRDSFSYIIAGNCYTTSWLDYIIALMNNNTRRDQNVLGIIKYITYYTYEFIYPLITEHLNRTIYTQNYIALMMRVTLQCIIL